MQKKVNIKLITQISTASIALLGFITIMVLVLCGYNFKIDNFNVIVANNRNAFLTGFLKIFTLLGSFYTLAVLTIIAVVFLWFVKKDKRLSAFYAIVFAKACIANFIFKQIVRRIRPLDLMIIKETGFSFPSGHAMMTLAFCALAIHFICRYLKNKPLKITLVTVFSLIVASIGFSRIYLGVHYLTDILAGWLLTFAIFVSGLIVYNSKMFKFLKDEESEQALDNETEE